MQHILKGIIILLALVLQSTLCRFIEIFGVAPNIVFAAVAAISLCTKKGPEAGAYGLFAGVLWDLLWGRVFGVHALLMMYSALAIYFLSGFLYKKNLLTAVLFTLGASIVYEAVFYIVTFSIWGNADFSYAVFRIIIPSAAYTAAFQILVYPLIKRVSAIQLGRGGVS